MHFILHLTSAYKSTSTKILTQCALFSLLSMMRTFHPRGQENNLCSFCSRMELFVMSFSGPILHLSALLPLICLPVPWRQTEPFPDCKETKPKKPTPQTNKQTNNKTTKLKVDLSLYNIIIVFNKCQKTLVEYFNSACWYEQ